VAATAAAVVTAPVVVTAVVVVAGSVVVVAIVSVTAAVAAVVVVASGVGSGSVSAGWIAGATQLIMVRTNATTMNASRSAVILKERI